MILEKLRISTGGYSYRISFSSNRTKAGRKGICLSLDEEDNTKIRITASTRKRMGESISIPREHIQELINALENLKI